MVHYFTRRATSDSAVPTRGSLTRRQSNGQQRNEFRKRAIVKDVVKSAKGATVDKLSKVHLKAWGEEDESDWWFAGTAVPLLAATIGPLANVLSIAALVTSWRMCLVDGVDPALCPYDGSSELLGDLFGHAFSDPVWCYWLNVVSLGLGCVGNIFLLFNFTGFVRYIIALPMTIIMWYMATGILIAITTSMNTYAPPLRPYQTYTQGFWYAVLAAIMYLIASMLLMLNMLGYFLGHFPQHFELSESQRTLILQTMLFFVWLAAGGGIFSKVETVFGDGSIDWSYTNALYFSDVTILTVGFGDLSCTSTVGRGLVFPYSVGGIIMLGLVITSISKFATELGSTKVIDKHRERSRAKTADRVVTSPEELRQRLQKRNPSKPPTGHLPSISGPYDPVNNSQRLRIVEPDKPDTPASTPSKPSKTNSSSSALTFLARSGRTATKTLVPSPLRKNRKSRPILLREERDRFNTMRRIELQTRQYKQWTALVLSGLSFSGLWLLGALVFYFAEANTQDLTYFEALYFCYVSLLTIGYGDLAPKSNLGRPFFVLWSLVAVPTMTILVGAMGDTVIEGFKRGVEKGAEVTILPRKGILGDVLRKAGIIGKIEDRRARKEVEKRLERGFEAGVDEDNSDKRSEGEDGPAPGGSEQDGESASRESSRQEEVGDLELAKRLALAIQRVAGDLRIQPAKRYEYDEWLDFTKLIKFTDSGGSKSGHGIGEEEDEEEELIEWDWIGENSPMMAKQTEPEFVLDRLCESMGRYLRRQSTEEVKQEKMTGAGVVEAAGALVEDDAESPLEQT
ncbi:hypothetical protein CAC42_4880 [Sphaceloma murrayae]|uniref:Potassium channel domain-containing protein n=1 Tax=Sphaceloma murrayae TaxID=2082308 RepID=A0A2K1QP86_9PEZI|nr:hypothetical protein CAC42_4880 [Sphaceloma murrayae]